MGRHLYESLTAFWLGRFDDSQTEQLFFSFPYFTNQTATAAPLNKLELLISLKIQRGADSFQRLQSKEGKLI